MAENAKSGKSEKNEPFSLSAKQERAIVAVLQSRSVEEACRNARVSKTLYYRWLREEPGFGAALKSRRDAAGKEALARLNNGLNIAVDVLVKLLASENEWVRRVAANDVICRSLKARELVELEERLQRLEVAVLRR